MGEGGEGAFMPEFPIPMRGNEAPIASTTIGWSQCGFPIPMRGNERIEEMRCFIRSVQFPIPMRGNEVIGKRRNAIGFAEFPIPMRGNEF